jgi:hypothetical protein
VFEVVLFEVKEVGRIGMFSRSDCGTAVAIVEMRYISALRE